MLFRNKRTDLLKVHNAVQARREATRAERQEQLMRLTEFAGDTGGFEIDTGPGIPESEREAVLEAGYSTNEEGTGFGLRTVGQIIEAHGWEVTVTEGEQGGARFEVTGVDTAG